MIVLSYPKSGRTWLLHMLADYYGYYLGNKDFTDRGKRFLQNGTMKPRNWVMGFHHIDLESLESTKKRYEKKCIYLMRDPRDCLTSFYFYKTYQQKKGMGKYWAFVRLQITKRGFLEEFLSGWVSHVDQYCDCADLIVKYEDLISDTVTTMKGMVDNPDEGKLRATVEKFDFEATTKRKPGDEVKSAFARKGIRGDWKNHFNDEKSKKIIKPIVNRHLIRWGYEADEDW